jgi:hypothetical protein
MNPVARQHSSEAIPRIPVVIVPDLRRAYSRSQREEPYRELGDWVAGSVLFAGSGEPGGDVHSRWVADARQVDSGIYARDLVTELREAHDSG